jgi:hypothetical protein
MLPKQVVTHSQLLAEGFTKTRIAAMSASLRLFPTPFKGIYYVPLEEERKGVFIERPMTVLTRAIALFLGGSGFYYSCDTAEEFLGIRWRPAGRIHVVNEALSGRVDLKGRIGRNRKKGTYRSRKIAKLLSLYGSEMIFHKAKQMRAPKTRQTPYGRFALKSQIKKDRKRFRCH